MNQERNIAEDYPTHRGCELWCSLQRDTIRFVRQAYQHEEGIFRQASRHTTLGLETSSIRFHLLSPSPLIFFFLTPAEEATEALGRRANDERSIWFMAMHVTGQQRL